MSPLRYVLRCMMVGLVAGVALVGIEEVPARGGVCVTPTGYTAYTNSGNQYGARSGAMKVFNTSALCAQVRSVVVWVDINNYAEIGYFEDEVGELEQCQNFDSPHVLVYAKQGTIFKCKQDPVALSAGTFYAVKVQNPNHDNRMNYYLGAAYQGFFTVSFNQGSIQSFTERHENGGPLHSNMDSLQYMGSAGMWNNWMDQTHVPASISGWTFIEDSNVHYRVVQS